MNYLSGDLSSIAKLFADDTSLFSVTHDITTSTSELNNDLTKITDWAFQWKMSFKQISKQANNLKQMTQANKLKKSYLVENEKSRYFIRFKINF